MKRCCCSFAWLKRTFFLTDWSIKDQLSLNTPRTYVEMGQLYNHGYFMIILFGYLCNSFDLGNTTKYSWNMRNGKESQMTMTNNWVSLEVFVPNEYKWQTLDPNPVVNTKRLSKERLTWWEGRGEGGRKECYRQGQQNSDSSSIWPTRNLLITCPFVFNSANQDNGIPTVCWHWKLHQ